MKRKNFEQFPFRNSVDDKIINDALNSIRSFVNKTNQDESLKRLKDERLKDSLNKIPTNDHKNFAIKRYYFSVIEELKKSFYNANFHKLKDQLDTLHSIDDIKKSIEIGELISQFNKNELEYLTSNKRFVFIFGSDLINQIKSKKQSKLQNHYIIIYLVL